MIKAVKSVVWAIGGLLVAPALAQNNAQNSPAQRLGLEMIRLNTLPFAVYTKPANTGLVLPETKHSGSLWLNLRADFQMAEVNSSLVRTHERKFAANPSYFNRTVQRSRPYMYYIYSEVKKRGMPAEAALLPFIESAFVTKAKSHVGASGLWQFMPATGRHYGLEQTPLYDGRHDVYAATDAALNYLQYLYGLFGDWSLAFAAYNWGEGNVSRAIRKAQASGLEPTYENLKMPNETRNYVPKLLAVRNLIANPEQFGLSLPEISHAPYFTAVTVNTPLDLSQAANLANISESEFLALNPAFKTSVFVPKGSRKMLLPVAAAATFEKNYKKSDSKSLLSWDIFTTPYAMTLTDIAVQTGTSVADLKRINGISGSTVNAGRSILVNKNGTANGQNPNNMFQIDRDNTPDTFVEITPTPVRTVTNPTQTATLAFPGTNPPFQAGPINVSPPEKTFAPQAAATANSIQIQVGHNPISDTDSDDPIQTFARQHNSAAEAAQPQTRVIQPAAQTAAAAAPIYHAHRVAAGETLYSIARRYQQNLDELAALNHLNGYNIRVGQVLKLKVGSAAP